MAATCRGSASPAQRAQVVALATSPPLNLSLACTIFAEEVMREIGRCLAPGGTCIISFSNRMFPSKAIYGWRRRSPP